MFYSALDVFLNLFFKYKDQTMYYLVHCVFNVQIIYMTYAAMIASVLDPMYLQTLTYNTISQAVIGFHLYHTVLYMRFLRTDDYLHHAMTIFTNMTAYVWDLQGFGHLITFTTTGLPGLFYYAPLFLLKNGIIDKNTELLCQYYVGLWMRSIGVLYASFYTLFSLFHGHTTLNDMPLVFVFINTGLMIWNAQYFLMLTIRAKTLRMP